VTVLVILWWVIIFTMLGKWGRFITGKYIESYLYLIALIGWGILRWRFPL